MSYHEFYSEQQGILDELIEEGIQNQIDIASAMAMAGKAQKFAEVAKPIAEGIGNIAKNVIMGENIKTKTVDVKKIEEAFNDSKRFVAEIKSKFPNSHAVIAKERQNLKVYQFALSNTVQDISLMADSTARDCEKTIKDLSLRQKIVAKGSMTGFKDSKLWKRVIDK